MRVLLACACMVASAPMPALAAAGPTATAAAPRERIRLDDGWRFHRGDPPGVDGRLDYDVRPDPGASEDGKDADARPQQAQALQATRPVLKPWILPSANPLLPPARRHARPAGEPQVGAVAFLRADFDDRGWQAVTLPHDWAIAGPFLVDGPYGGMGRLPSWGVGWYRRALDIPASAAGRRVLLEVDGAMSHASVWLNGRLVGGWPYGYSGWRLDLTPYLRVGARNQLAIRLDNPPESARWYPGAGLYRDVWLTTLAPLHVAQDGVRITTPTVSAQAAQIELQVAIDNAGDAAAQLEVDSAIFALDDTGVPVGEAVAHAHAPPRRIAAGASAQATLTARVEHPRLWGPPPTQRPQRYLAVTTLRRDGEVVDRDQSAFGIRSVRFDAQQGLLVNGERIPVRGVNLHHDLGALGAAFNRRAAERQLQLLQGMGANAIRTAHNPPAPELLELADRMGLLVLDEIFDSWQRRKTALDFHLLFDDWSEADLRALLRRDRNHPSVVLWGIGNEVGEQYTGDDGAAIARRLAAIAHAEDPTRPVTAAMNYAKPDMPLPAALDVIGLNYQGEGIRQDPQFAGSDRIRTPPQYAAFHARFPQTAILSTETSSALDSRGIYLFPVTPQDSAPVRDGRGGDLLAHQVSAYGLYAVDFGSSPDKVFAALDAHPFVAGEFVWTGFDYLGEPTPYYDARSSYSGIFDLAGFAKDRYWLYQARWRPDLPMAHLLPHWTWPGRAGQVTPVHVFTSGDAAELFVNGVSQGRRTRAPGQSRLRWDDVVYQPGELRVQAYKDGRPWASDSVRTAGAPARLQLAVDRARIAGDGRDLAYVDVRVLDADGVAVPTASHAIRFEVAGPATLVATDNGDPTDMTAFPSPRRHAFSGRALAIVRAVPQAAGTVTVRATADGLQGDALTFEVGD
jgi:beta-galactosidase